MERKKIKKRERTLLVYVLSLQWRYDGSSSNIIAFRQNPVVCFGQWLVKKKNRWKFVPCLFSIGLNDRDLRKRNRVEANSPLFYRERSEYRRVWKFVKMVLWPAADVIHILIMWEFRHISQTQSFNIVIRISSRYVFLFSLRSSNLPPPYFHFPTLFVFEKRYANILFLFSQIFNSCRRVITIT